MISPVRSSAVWDYWDRLEPHLTRIVEFIDTGHTSEDIAAKIARKEYQLWVVNDWESILVTQILVLPQHKVLQILYCVGMDVDTWKDAAKGVILEFAQHVGAKYIEGFCRPGWTKVLKKYSCDVPLSVMRFEVDGQRRRR